MAYIACHSERNNGFAVTLQLHLTYVLHNEMKLAYEKKFWAEDLISSGFFIVEIKISPSLAAL